MIIYPAIDIKNGKCVRLQQGLASQETVYFDNPLDAAKNFLDLGAKWIHIVDLDGAFEGTTKNFGVIEKIANLGMCIELGGGMRSKESVQIAVDSGIMRAIVGTKACENPEFAGELVNLFGDKIAVGIDAKGGFVAIKGWVEVSKISAKDLAKKVADFGVKTIIYTDIDTDGMLQGPNLKAQEEMLENLKGTQTSLIASGGISSASDIDNIFKLSEKHNNLNGVITGKAIYDGKITTAELKTLIAKYCLF